MNKMNTPWISGMGLFRDGHRKCNGEFQNMGPGFVADLISKEEMDRWLQIGDRGYRQEQQPPVFLWAPTGRGKNYFIMHNLREYAKQRDRSILYVSNRVALDYQQKQELAKLTYTTFTWDTQDFDKLEDIEVFNNMSIITYHKLRHRLYSTDKSSKQWLGSFDYVVLDEAHFFCSDATFNAETGDILRLIPDVFRRSVRIYLSATFEKVFEPIRYYEGLMNSSLYHDSCLLRYAYRFPCDYSAYTFKTFSNINQIFCLAAKASHNNKMLIFVQSKEVGRKLVKSLQVENSNSTTSAPVPVGQKAAFLDSGSRRSEDIAERLLWETTKREGRFDFPVLVTTCVLDNGFSIKDTRLKTIVICADDATEAIQELGRCRLENGQKVSAYIQKMTKKRSASLRRRCSNYLDIFSRWYAESQETLQHNEFVQTGEPIKTVKSLWNHRDDPRRNLIGFRETKDGTLKPFINDMAKWWCLRMLESDDAYRALAASDPNIADSVFVLRWFDPNLALEDRDYILRSDIDVSDRAESIAELTRFLDNEARNWNPVNEAQGEPFRARFTALYKEAYPDDKATSRSKNRSPVFSFLIISNRLAKQPDLEQFRLTKVKDTWHLSSQSGRTNDKSVP